MQLLKEEAVLLSSRPIFKVMALPPLEQETIEPPNKNPDLGVETEESKGEPIHVKPYGKLTTRWRALKVRR